MNHIRKKYLINFGDVWHCHNENSLSNATLHNKWHQSKKSIPVVIPFFFFFFFFFKIYFFFFNVFISLQEMALQKKRKLINRSLPMQCTFNTAGFKISQEIIDNLGSMIILQIQESWTWIDGNRIKRSIQITSRPQIQNFSTIRNIKPSSIAIWHIYGPIPIHNTTLAAAATKRSFVLTKCGKTGEHCIRYFQSRDCCCRICSRVRS